MTIFEYLKDVLKMEEKKARFLIMTDAIFINGEKAKFVGQKITSSDVIEIKDKEKEFVSRGAYKLLSAIEKFNINLDSQVVLDIGSSTGGFTQVALKNNAKLVYALDVGTNQLDYQLRKDARVISLEKTNLKSISPEMFSILPTWVVCDVSFISLQHVFSVLKDFDVKLIALIKPQFEADSFDVEQGGYVSEEKHQKIIDKIIKYASENKFKLDGIEKSPILGAVSKNIEYLALFSKEE